MDPGLWMGREGEMAHDNTSRVEAKRSSQWFMDGTEAEDFPSKRQTIEVPSNGSFLGLLNMNVSPWGFSAGFNPLSAHFSEQALDTETTGAGSYNDRSITSFNAEKVNTQREMHGDPFPSNSPFGLSISHTSEDPGSGLSYGALRKVKVNQVRDSENVTPLPMGHGFNRVVGSAMLTESFCKVEENPMSIALASSVGDGNILASGNNDGGENNIAISRGKLYDNEDESTSIRHAYKEDTDAVSVGINNSVLSAAQGYGAEDCSMSMGHILSHGNHSLAGNIYEHDDNNSLSANHSYSKGQSTIISFGGHDDYDDNSSSRLIYGQSFFSGPPLVQTRDAVINNQLVKSNGDAFINSTSILASGAGANSRKKEEQNSSKKASSNNFPSNVRSLLSTGILDGIPVKYTAWSREKELHGVIRGSGYLCGCQSCNYTKVINAYEFERHAGCKTKHPNNHIYFENGKTIYGIVQELRGTPQSMLFEVMQTITGSPINQKSFRLWKESYLAATRELQRIYAKDEGEQLT